MYIEFKQGEKHASKGADTSDSLDSFRDAGYLLEKDDVVIDIDCLSKEKIKVLLDWFNIRTKRVWTDRGVHLYYKKPLSFGKAKNGICQLGFPIEMKTSTNSPNGITVKRDGVARIVENESIREELPEMFNDRKQYNSLLGFGDGDGRNNALFAHKMKLANCVNWDLILKFINEYVFDEPLDEDEFRSLSRQQSVTDQDANEYIIATDVMNTFKTVIYNGKLYWYNGKQYLVDPDNERLIRLVYERCGNKPSRYVDEIVKQIRYRSRIISRPEFPIKFKNGVFDVDGQFEEVDYEEFTPYYININYLEDAEPVQMVDDYINQLTGNDPDYRRLLAQILGYALITNTERIKALGKFFIFRGDGRNGKGTLLQIIRTIFNPENCTSMSIKQLADPRYSISMIGKLVNLGDDLEPDAINNDQMKIIKNISTADETEGRHLFKEAENVLITAKMYFTSNSDIKSYEKGYAFQRRVLWLPMFTKVEKVDPLFITKITTKAALEHWVKFIIEGAQDLLETGWHPCKVVEDYNTRYHESNNPMLTFINDIDVEQAVLGRTVNEIKEAFIAWSDDDTQHFSSRLFKETVWEKHKIGIGMIKQNGKMSRCFLRQSDTQQDLSPK